MPKQTTQRKRSAVQRIALTYINPSIVHHASGEISCREYFNEKGDAGIGAQASVDQMWRGGVRLAIMSLGVNEMDLFPGAAAVDYAMRCFDALLVEIEQSCRCVLIKSRRDLRQAERDNKLAIVLHLTGCPINKSLQVLRQFHRIGIRSMHPVIRDDTYGGEWKSELGLTPLGKAVIREMESLGMLVDTAHMSDQSFRDTVKIAKKPFIDSHAGCRAIVDKMRNRSDRDLKTIGHKNGVVGVHFDSKLLTDIGRDPRAVAIEAMQVEVRKLRKRYKEPYEYLSHRYDPHRWPKALGGAKDDGIEPTRATIDDVCDHLERMIAKAGARHVAIGTDYALGSICGSLETADKLPALTEALRQRGLSKAVINDILYRNTQRLLMSVLPAI